MLSRLQTCAIALFVFGTGPAQATIFFTFGAPLEGQPPIDGTPPFAQLAIQDAGPNVVHMTLTHCVDVGGIDPARFISRLALNLEPFDAGVTLLNPTLPITLSSGPDAFADAGYRFDLMLDFPTSNQQDRLEQGQTVSWDLTASGLTEARFNATAPHNNGQPSSLFSLLHMQGIGPNGLNSTKLVGSPVPEPASCVGLALCAAGVLMLRRNVK